MGWLWGLQTCHAARLGWQQASHRQSVAERGGRLQRGDMLGVVGWQSRQLLGSCWKVLGGRLHGPPGVRQGQRAGLPPGVWPCKPLHLHRDMLMGCGSRAWLKGVPFCWQHAVRAGGGWRSVQSSALHEVMCAPRHAQHLTALHRRGPSKRMQAALTAAAYQGPRPWLQLQHTGDAAQGCMQVALGHAGMYSLQVPQWRC